jgi:hypothetical protein
MAFGLPRAGVYLGPALLVAGISLKLWGLRRFS